MSSTIWAERALDTLGFLGRGKSKHRPRNAPFLYDGPYPFIQTADVTNSELHVLHYTQTYSEAGLAQSKLWEPDTLCIVNAGVNTGDTAILAFRACFPDSVIGFVADDSASDVRFIKYFLDSKKAEIRQVTMGATQDNLSVSKLLSFKVPTPPVDTQRKIGGILSAYDELIENNLRRIRISEEMAQKLYREWFVDLRFPDHRQAKFADSALGSVPEGWVILPLGKLAVLRKDKFNEELHAQTPLLDLARMQSRTLVVGETGSPAELTTSRILFQENDILFGSIRPYLHKVALAPYRGVTNVSVLVLRAVTEFLQSFLAVLLSSVDTIRWADKHSTGTKMPVIKWEALSSMPVLMPPQELLAAFEASVQPMLESIKIASSRNRNLRRTRDLLLPKLISGELDVSELDVAVPEDTA